PHFEKMLYDNAQLLALYADALRIGPDELFSQAVRETTEWLLREMRHTGGGFYAALDADSEGGEGLFYLWRRDQLKRLLDETEYLIVETLYGVDKPANFEGRWNLHRHDAWRSVVERLSLPRAEADAALASARSKMLAERDLRPRPGLDDKILTSWNGLTIRGLARAGMVLDEPSWIDRACECADFIRTSLWDGQRLSATWQQGRARHPGYLDDYANLLNGLLTLLGARWRETDAAFARALADAVIEQFYDTEQGGFFFTAHTHERLIYRPKPTLDDAQPPGNGVMAQVLMELGHLFGETRYLETAAATLDWAKGKMTQFPAGHCSLISALELELRGPEQIIIRGPADQLAPWLAVTRSGYKPWRSSFAIAYEDNRTLPAYLPRLTSADLRNRTVAYRCEGMSCSLPIESVEELKKVCG
ncbi:MAG: thioredoxin domain-containing protein, partial [Pseudomonadales bacterium]|nr:thioredoxin domain-containing protein [Pseudomonadales bacterium]